MKFRAGQEACRVFALCTLATTGTICSDVKANFDVSDQTIYDYIHALEKLYIIEDVEARCPAVRSKSAIRSSNKRNLIDPSIAVAALGLSPEYFNSDTGDSMAYLLSR